MTDEEVERINNETRAAARAQEEEHLAVENEFTGACRALEGKEGDAHEAGLAVGRATIKMRELYRYKKPGLQARIKELGYTYWKCYYWANVVEGKSNNRHKKYWDEREFCVTQNSTQPEDTQGTANADQEDKGGAPANVDQDDDVEAAAKEAAEEVAGPPQNRNKSNDLVKLEFYFFKNQKIDLRAALKKLINHKVGTNPSEVIFKLVTEKAAALDGKDPKAVELPATATIEEVVAANNAEMASQVTEPETKPKDQAEQVNDDKPVRFGKVPNLPDTYAIYNEKGDKLDIFDGENGQAECAAKFAELADVALLAGAKQQALFNLGAMLEAGVAPNVAEATA